MDRPDLSPHLIHFTKPYQAIPASFVLSKILLEKRLVGSGTLVRGGHRCVSFTEAPLACFQRPYRDYRHSRYSMFGIRFEKDYIFSLGGRPAIYQPDNEYALLPPELQWRHVRYWPVGKTWEDGRRDWTWEREWRLPGDLDLDPERATVIVPDEPGDNELREYFEKAQDARVEAHALFDRDGAELNWEEFAWRVERLE